MSELSKITVSIITPMYNAEKYIEATFNSVLNQTYSNYEWIIVDDKSTDKSLEIVTRLINNNKRIKLISLEANSGAAKARNVGLDHAKGGFIVFLDADDELDSCFLEKQLEFIKEHGPIITAGYRRKTPNSITNFIPPKETTYKSILKGNPISCLSTMYDFKLFKNERFDEKLDRHEDYLFWINLLKQGYVAYGNQDVLATYILHEGSKNINKRKLLKPMYNLYRKELKLSIIKSFYYLVCIVRYSKKKYRNV